MAIDLYSENSSTSRNISMSPRISFSHDLSNSDTIPVEQLLHSFSSSSSTVDFNFCVQQNPENHHADELFSDGKFIPTKFKKTPKSPQVKRNSPVVVDDDHHISSSKSFWGFKRSSSCGNANGNGYVRSLCPIPLLNRSNSTGLNTKRSSSLKEGCVQKQHHSNCQKPPLRRTSYGYGNGGSTSHGVRVNPVLNLGFGSLFSSGMKK